MAGLLDTALVVGILLFLALIVWSKIMKQTMLETVSEIREIMSKFREPTE